MTNSDSGKSLKIKYSCHLPHSWVCRFAAWESSGTISSKSPSTLKPKECKRPAEKTSMVKRRFRNRESNAENTSLIWVFSFNWSNRQIIGNLRSWSVLLARKFAKRRRVKSLSKACLESFKSARDSQPLSLNWVSYQWEASWISRRTATRNQGLPRRRILLRKYTLSSKS